MGNVLWMCAVRIKVAQHTRMKHRRDLHQIVHIRSRFLSWMVDFLVASPSAATAKVRTSSLRYEGRDVHFYYARPGLRCFLGVEDATNLVIVLSKELRIA